MAENAFSLPLTDERFFAPHRHFGQDAGLFLQLNVGHNAVQQTVCLLPSMRTDDFGPDASFQTSISSFHPEKVSAGRCCTSAGNDGDSIRVAKIKKVTG